MTIEGLRKLVFVQETVYAEGGSTADRPVSRVAAIAIVRNPLAGVAGGDLDRLAVLSDALGETAMPRAVALLADPAVAYGKGALVGVHGELEHGAAMLHPRLGRSMRAAVGGGAAIIGSNCKVAAAGAALDIPLMHKDDIWSFDHLDTMTVMVGDAPRPDEIVLVMVIGSGGRIRARVSRSAP